MVVYLLYINKSAIFNIFFNFRQKILAKFEV